MLLIFTKFIKIIIVVIPDIQLGIISLYAVPLYGAKLPYLITGHVGGAGACPPTCKMRTFFHIPLALSMTISNKFQLNGASGETLNLM